MNSAIRNIAVGLTVIAALAALGAMIVMFGGDPEVGRNTYRVKMTFDEAGPIQANAEVRVAGVTVGKVARVEPLDGFRNGVLIVAHIEDRYSIPADCVPTIRPVVMGLGKPVIEITVPQDASHESVARDGSAVLAGKVLTGFEGLIDDETKEKFDRFVEVFGGMVGLPDEDTTTRPEDRANLRNIIVEVHTALRSLNHAVNRHGDDISAVVTNVRQASEDLKVAIARGRSILEKLDGMTGQFETTLANADGLVSDARGQMKVIASSLRDTLSDFSGTLDRVNRVLAAVEAGKGTAGRFVNDPRRSDELVRAADRLNKTLAQVQELIARWQATGVELKLK
jgi:phospholipid/cholesterol/gamma-HCH transport system substrate-binding protein